MRPAKGGERNSTKSWVIRCFVLPGLPPSTPTPIICLALMCKPPGTAVQLLSLTWIPATELKTIVAHNKADIGIDKRTIPFCFSSNILRLPVAPFQVCSNGCPGLLNSRGAIGPTAAETNGLTCGVGCLVVIDTQLLCPVTTCSKASETGLMLEREQAMPRPLLIQANAEIAVLLVHRFRIEQGRKKSAATTAIRIVLVVVGPALNRAIVRLAVIGGQGAAIGELGLQTHGAAL